ncbi:FadR/GntR family transcriptional regulator [Castellaniella sp.]|uniref:FadR/GntR family transcriptional regulator n=1 Tax=Castellaniella sp. TaxID=1955812 RepID=UPI0035698576
MERTTAPEAAADPAVLAATNLPDEIADYLITAIREGRYTVGDRIPTERELCQQFSVSRAVVREALSQLKSEGLVVSRAGSGVFVSEPNYQDAFRLQLVALDEKESLAMVIELLAAFETAAARLAAQRRTEADLKNIRRALVGMEYEIAHDRLGDEQDFAFHQAIVNATHNPHYQALSKHLEHNVRRLIRRARSNTRANLIALVEDVQEEHRAIYAAIKAGDPRAASQAAGRHLSNAAKRLQIYLQD